MTEIFRPALRYNTHLPIANAQPFSRRRKRHLWWLPVAFFSVMIVPGTLCSQDAQVPGSVSADESAAQDLAQIAARAQNDNEYQLAAQQWEKLLTEHPNSILVGKAHYNAGVCFVQMQDYPAAAVQLSAAISKLVGDDAHLQPHAYLYLGFSQMRSGQELNRKSDDASKKEANILLTTSTKTLADLLNKFPDFVLADQACYFQGSAFEDLQRLEDAEKSYTKMMTFEKQTFRFEGLFALANVSEQLGEYSLALEKYQTFRSEAAANGGHALLDEVNYHTAKTLIALAVADTNRGDATGAAEKYQQAEKLLTEIVQQDRAGKPAIFLVLADEAEYQLAFCVAQLGDFERAGKIYESLAARPDTQLRPQALLQAGRSYLQAGKIDLAIANLQLATEADSPSAIEGAAALSNLYLKNDNPQAAFELTDQWIKKTPNSPLLPLLMADRADAAFRLPEKKAECPALFLEVADKFSQHSVAPSALYNAAFALLELNALDDSIEIADRFEKDYPSSDFLPDTREVKADALLLKKDAAAAEQGFDQLIQSHPQHQKINYWRLRSALAKCLQEKYQPVIDMLQPNLDTFTESKRLAEAEYRIGASYFYLDQFEPAIAHLQKSIATEPQWRSADETLLTLARAQFKFDHPDEAKATIKQLISNFPKSPLIGNAYYYLGEQAYATKQYEIAFDSFQAVVDQFPNSELAPLSMYNAAWSKLELKEFDAADSLFSKLIADFPKHELAEKARLGRGATLRKTGNTAESVADLTAFLATNPTGQQKFDALYELGLAQVEGKEWSGAVKSFETLLAEDTDSPRYDRYRYELAWALQSLERSADALQQFASIVQETPNSEFAAEANFHLGTAAYQRDDFPAAIAAYQKCVSDAKNPSQVREKALYKLGWAYYKQDQFERAYEQFAKQVKNFPDSELTADGKFMVAESQFRQKKYEPALTAYFVAKPAVDAAIAIDPKIKLLTMLHGAQSANQIKKYEEALALATPLTTTDVDPSFQQDAWLEIGTANEGLRKPDEALSAWSKAKLTKNTTGARAGCMIGDLLFKQQKFSEAIDEFKLVNYRFGGLDMSAETKPWIAYALYEAARCSFVQVADAPAEKKAALIAEAIKQFETLVQDHPNDRLAPEARNQLEKLKKL